MKKVFYHQEGREPKPFVVLSENKDGTINIGPADGEPVVTSALLLKEPRNGSCTAAEDASPADSNELTAKKVDELRVIAKDLGIEVTGLKKDELITAIEAAKKPQ